MKLKVFLGTLLLLVVLAFGGFWWMAEKIKSQQPTEDQWKVISAFEELNLVFPTYFTIKDEKNHKVPDLKTIVDTLNTAQIRSQPVRGVKSWGGIIGVPFKPLNYRIGRPDGPWQLVLNYDKTTGLVKAEAYGDDLSKPVSMREYTGYH